MALELDKDLMDRWIEAKRQIDEVQLLRDEAKRWIEKEEELDDRITVLKAEIESLETTVEELTSDLNHERAVHK